MLAYLPAWHAVHAATFEAVEYFPMAHWLQILAPTLAPVFVSEPGGHRAQSIASFEPVVPTYRPAGQLIHVTKFEAVEYWPTAHFVHVVAPVPCAWFVIEPAAHTVHEESVDIVEYMPTGHAMHAFAPATEPESVIDPAAQSEQ